MIAHDRPVSRLDLDDALFYRTAYVVMDNSDWAVRVSHDEARRIRTHFQGWIDLEVSDRRVLITSRPVKAEDRD